MTFKRFVSCIDVFVSRQDYCSLVWNAMNDWKQKMKIVPPAIVKPQPLWSGKQVHFIHFFTFGFWFVAK